MESGVFHFPIPLPPAVSSFSAQKFNNPFYSNSPLELPSFSPFLFPPHPTPSLLSIQSTAAKVNRFDETTSRETCQNSATSFTIDRILSSPGDSLDNANFSQLHHSARRKSFMTKQQCKKEAATKDGRQQNENKRMRTIFTPEQLDRLEAEFDRQQYMVGSERYYLAASLNLTESQVKVWFQNRRIKWRKQHLGEQREHLKHLHELSLSSKPNDSADLQTRDVSPDPNDSDSS